MKQIKLKVVDGFRIRFKPGETELNDAYEYGYDFGCTVLMKENTRKQGARQLVKCMVCGEIFDSSLDRCPVCGVGKENFQPVSEDDVREVKKSDDHYVVVGGGAAAFNAMKAIRKYDKTGWITLISNEPYLPYSRPMLTKVMATGIDPKQLLLEQEDYYASIDVRLNCEVTAVNSAEKTVTVNGVPLGYDKLVIATGAECFVPPFKGKDLDGVYTIRHILDTDKIYQEISNVKSGVVVGGGVLGLEAAWQLCQLGISVTVVQGSDYLLNRQLDPESSGKLKLAAEGKGVQIHLGGSVEEILGSEHVSGVRLSDGTVVEAQIVIISTGVRANVALAQSAGCAVKRAIVVDEHMKTSVEDIYAAGDCAEYLGVNMQLWGEAVEQGRIAGVSAAGGDGQYAAEPVGVSFYGFGTSLFAIGDAGKNEAHRYKTVTVEEQGGRYQKLFFLNGRLQGAVIIGGTPNVVEVTKAVEQHVKLEEYSI
jgi:NAD(P)H-nitrite reductase large subunit